MMTDMQCLVNNKRYTKRAPAVHLGDFFIYLMSKLINMMIFVHAFNKMLKKE